MATVAGNLKTKFTDDLGEPLVGGKVYTYHAGTSTPKDSYQDKEFAVVNTNPIVLDDAGSCDLYLNGLYRLRVLDKDGVFVEERDYMTQGDSTGLSITDNANNITVLQSEVQAINERSVLKLDEHNFIIAHGRADSATVYDPVFRADKLKLALQGQEDSARNIFKTYAENTTLNGNEIKAGTYLDPALQAVELGTAATRDVGTGAEQVPLNKNIPLTGFESLAHHGTNIERADNRNYNGLNYVDAGNGSSFPERYNNYVQFEGSATSRLQIYFPYFNRGTSVYLRRSVISSQGGWQPFEMVYTTGNTNKGTNGALSAKSPVTHLYHDRIEHTGDDLELHPIKFIKNGVGDYTLKNTTGFAQEGWYIIIPQDANGNQLVAVEYEDNDGEINIRTYKRKFDFEQAKIVADYDHPLDIPETRWIDLRFNEDPSLYGEVNDEPIE